MREVERFGDSDQLPFRDFEGTGNGLHLFAHFKDALDECGHLSIWIGQLGKRLGGFGRWCRGCDSREVDPLEPGTAPNPAGLTFHVVFLKHVAHATN